MLCLFAAGMAHATNPGGRQDELRVGGLVVRVGEQVPGKSFVGERISGYIQFIQAMS